MTSYDTVESLQLAGHITDEEVAAYLAERDFYERIRRETRLIILGQQRRASIDAKLRVT